jgi:asparagine synthase (glutamine-hydrolysing)
MCGIFGMISHGGAPPVSLEVLERATHSLAHRGPDDGGTIILRDPHPPAIEIGLGHRRLAILDLSPRARQPMHDPSTGNWIVYNGEVYNFPQVRAKLQRAGFEFHTSSDTEVILKAYARWGERCLEEFRGMFAFAIWDAQRHRLFAARDPMGIKPFYYYQSSQHFLFSSEVRTLLQTGLIPRRIDSAGLLNYLTYGSLCDPITLIEGVRSLPAGHSLTWQSGRLTTTEYWDLVDLDSDLTGSDDQLPPRSVVDRDTDELLDQVVRMQLVSDVPVGIFLSGGIDSSALTAILSRSGIQPSTFSIVFRESEYSEAEYSRAIAQLFRTDHHEITVSHSDLFQAIGPALRAMDLPTIDGINTFFVSREARAAGVKVALSGLGGDEVFAGYSSFRTVPRMERFARRLPVSVRSPLARVFAAVAPATDRNRKLTALAETGQDSIHPYFLSRTLFTPERQCKLLPARSDDTESRECAESSLASRFGRTHGLDPVNRVSYLESRCYMLNTLLRDSDSMSMAHGLEVRVPLIDHQLAKRILALPGSWKLHPLTPKPLLVRSLRGALPDRLVNRPKRGFTLPFEQWLRADLRPVVEQSLRKIQDSALGALVSAPACLEIWSDFLAGRTSWSRPWSLYVLQSWCELHLAG